MLRHFTRLFIVSFSFLILGCSSPDNKPKYIFLFISDGCGYYQIDAASLYQYGETGRQVYESFPVKYAMSTYASDGIGYSPDEAWLDFEYVMKKPTDSAAAATAMSTGTKTYKGAICVSPDSSRLKSMVEIIEQTGKATGVVTSAQCIW